MTLFSRSEPVTPTNPENPSSPLSNLSDTLLGWFRGGTPTAAGQHVNQTNALQMSAVFRCVSLIASVGGELPLVPYRRGTFERVTSTLLEAPHPEYTPFEFWRLMLVHRALWGNAYAQKIYNNAGQVAELWPIHPSRVTPGRASSTDMNPSGKVFVVQGQDGVEHHFTSREIFHVPHLGYDGVAGLSPIALARQAIGMGMAAEEYAAKLFGSGNMISGFVSTEQQLNKEKAELAQQLWRDKMLGRNNQHDVLVLGGGMTFQPMTMPNADAQFLESRQFQVPEIGRWYGVPAFLLFSTEKSTSWGTGLEQQSTGFSTYDLGPQWLSPHEQRVSRELLPRPHEARYDRARLLRGDSAARGTYYAYMRQWGGLTANEVRANEGLPPIEGGDQAIQPLNMGPLGAEPPDDPEPPAPPDPPEPPPSSDDETDPEEDDEDDDEQ